MKNNQTFTFKSLFILLIISFSIHTTNGQNDFKKYEVTSNFTNGFDIFISDINQDGNPDIAAIGKGSGGEVAWFENDGFQNFTKHQIKNNFAGGRSVRAVDLDQDGEVDIVASAVDSNTIAWWKNDGEENWTEFIIDDDFTGAHTVEVKDVNEDGFLDVLCCGFDLDNVCGEIAWWENDGSENFTKHLVSDRFIRSCFVYGEDMDGDTDVDIIACGETNDEILWWENDGSENFTEHMIDDNMDAIHTILARDVDSDGDMDITAAACLSSKMAWYENKGYNDFEKHNLQPMPGALWLDACDLDMDGDLDMFGCGMGFNKLVIYYNDGDNNFSPSFIDETFTSGFCVRSADMDNDTDPDLVAIGYSSSDIAWFGNQAINPDYLIKPESVAFDFERQRYLVSSFGFNTIVAIDKSTHLQSLFIEDIPSPMGNCIHDGVLYVSTNTTLKAYDLETGNETMSIHIPCQQHLDGMTTDNEGNLYVIDTGGEIYKINLATQGFTSIVSSGLVQGLQDCIFDEINNRLLTISYSPGAPIQAIDLETYEVSTATTTPFGYYDGISIDPEGNVYLASHMSPGRVIKYFSDMSNFEVLATGNDDPAGLDYNAHDKMLVVPNFGGNSLSFIDLNPIGMLEMDMGKSHLKIYPNPNQGKFWVGFNKHSQNDFETRIFSTDGKLIYQKKQQIGDKEIDLYGLPLGVYILAISQDDGSILSQKLIIE